MGDLVVNAGLLKALAERNEYRLPGSDMLFFGIRGALPIDTSGTRFAAEHPVRLTDLNYQHMRCTIGQWRRSDDQVALFPGSTVPHLRALRGALAGGDAANMLMLGKYLYRKGTHKRGKPSGHRAFQQGAFFPVWRTRDDLDFDLADKVDLGGPAAQIFWDNLHCAFNDNIDMPSYGSAGCQVVAGHPKSAARNFRPETGPWAKFVRNAYDETPDQSAFAYLLFSAAELALLATRPREQVSKSLRFGSEGQLVRDAQALLAAEGMPVDVADGVFGRDTLDAVMAFQTAEFGRGTADGVIGPNTARALGLTLPKLAGVPVPAPAS